MANARLDLGGQTVELPLVTGTMGEKAVDITNLRKDSGYITLDSGYQNTGSCKSAITFIDGDKGILKYRGVNIEELAANARFTEVAYFLVHGRFADQSERAEFSQQLTENSMLHEDMIKFFHSVPPTAHPMSILSTMVNAMSIFYPQYFVD